MERKQYLTEERKQKILEVFKDQKIKYKLEELPTSKIQGLTGINQYQLKEVLSEMEEKGIIKKRIEKQREYWRIAWK